jgi:hypothetical protein
VKYVVAYEPDTPYDDHELRCLIVDGEPEAAELFARSHRAWLGEQVARDETPWSPICEPGYALVTAGPKITEYFEWAAMADELARDASAIAIRITARKPTAEPAWPPEARVLRDQSVANFDSDDARVVFADAIAGKRGALVVVQCDLALDGMTPAESRSRRRAQRKLLAKDGVTWSRLGQLATRCVFRRGFVEAAAMEPSALIEHAARVFDAAPHLQSAVVPVVIAADAKVLAVPELRRLRGLHLVGPAGWHVSHIRDRSLGHLRAFGIDRLAPAGAHELVARAGLANLEVLRLDEHELGGDALAALVRTSPQLRVLDVGTQRSSADLVGAIPASVRELHITGATLSALANAPFAPTLEKLALHGLDLTYPRPFSTFRALRSLDLFDARVTAALADTALPALRELRCNVVTPAQARTIATAFGPQLELLDLRGAPLGVGAIARELRELVAGDVWIGAAASYWKVMTASYLPFEPMWDLEEVELADIG